MSFFLATLLKPFVAVFFFAITGALAHVLAKSIPNGRIKDVLTDKTLRERRPVLFTLFIVLASFGTPCLMVWLYGGLKAF